MALDERVKKCIQAMTFQLPQQTVNEQFDQQFCNESYYGSLNVLEVTGLVCLAPMKWTEIYMALCMLSHPRLGSKSTLGAARGLWITKAGLEVMRIIITQVARDEEEDDKGTETDKVKVTVWPTEKQKERTHNMVRGVLWFCGVRDEGDDSD